MTRSHWLSLVSGAFLGGVKTIAPRLPPPRPDAGRAAAPGEPVPLPTARRSAAAGGQEPAAPRAPRRAAGW